MFNFEKALSLMKTGAKIIGPGGRIYAIEKNELVCYPKPKERPKQRRVEVKLNTESILSEDWDIYVTMHNK